MTRRRERELRRDEVFIGGHVLPEEWARDNAYVDYRIMKYSGWLGRLYLIAFGLAIIASLFGFLDRWPWAMLVLWGLGITTFAVGSLRILRRRRV